MTHQTLNLESQIVLSELDKNRTIWQRTYAPLRRALAGNWSPEEGFGTFEVRLEPEGSFMLVNAGLRIDGSFWVAPVGGLTYLILESETSRYALKIEDINSKTLHLEWAGEEGNYLFLTRVIADSVRPRIELI